MPTYTYKCEVCEKTTDAIRKIADRANGPECHGVMRQMIIPPMIAPVLGGGDMPGYQCPITDQFVTSRKQRKEIMKEHNLEERG